MANLESDEFRVVIFKDGGAYVAQCLEYDICAQAADLNTVRSRMEATMNAEVHDAQEAGKKPFEGIDRAPQRFFDMWENCAPFRHKSKTAKEDGVALEMALVAA